MPYLNIRKVTIDHTKVVGGANLTNFPFLFSGTYAGSGGAPDLRSVANGGQVQNSSGYDIVFATGSSLVTLLSWDVKTYNPVTGEVVIWVQVPTLFSGADTNIYLAYGNAAIATFQGGAHGAAWDSNFKAVHHFPGSGSSVSATVVDATANGNDLPTVSMGSNALVSSPLGLAMQGSGQYVYGSGFTDLPTAPPLTLECWLKDDTSGRSTSLSGFGDNSGGGINRCQLYLYRPGGSTYLGEEGALFTWTEDTNWHHLAVTWASGITQHSQGLVYFDGVLQTLTHTGNWHTAPASPAELIIGGTAGAPGVGDWFGAFVENRISNVARSAGWIATTYNSGISAATFYSVGPQIGVFATLVIDDGPGLTDRTNYLLLGDNMQMDFSLQIKTRGTATITLTVPSSDSYTPTTGSLLYLSDLNVPLCVFAGTIDSWQITYQSNEGLRYIALTCTDMVQTLDTICIPPRAYFGMTAGAIITDIYNTVLAPTIPFSLGTISAGITVPALLLTWDKVSDVINNLAAASQFAWGIDYSAAVGGAATPTLYFDSPGAVGSALTLVTTDILWGTAQYTETRSNFINRQIVRISYNAFTSLTDYNATPNGILTSFTLRYPAYQVQSAGLTTSTQSTQTGTFTGVPANNDTITLAGRTYTWKTTLDNTMKDQIFIGATAAACATNLADAINANPATAGAGFSFPTWYHQTLAASASSATVTVVVMISGSAGNGTGLSASTTHFSWAGSTTSGGTDGLTTALTVGVSGSGSTAQLYYTSGSATLTLATAPDSGVALVVAYQRYGADCIVCENTASVNARAMAEGGTGHYEVLTADTSETNPDTALLAAQAIIVNYCVFPDLLQFETDIAGWVLGQEVTTALTGMGTLSSLVTGNWLIHQVDGKLVIPNDPRLQYLGFRYTVYIVNTSTVATYVQFFQQLAAPAATTPGASNPNSGAGAAASGPQFSTNILAGNITNFSIDTTNNNGVQLTVSVTQAATGGPYTFTFNPAEFSVNAGDTMSTGASSVTIWVFQGNGTLWLETSYKQQ